MDKKDKKFAPDNALGATKRLFSYFRFNLGTLIIGIITIILSAVSLIAVNYMLSPIIDSAVAKDGSSFIYNIIIMCILVLFYILNQYVGNRSMGVLAHKTVYIIRQDLHQKIMKLPVSYFDSHSHGEVMSTFTNDVDLLIQSLEQSIAQIILALISFVGTLGVMFLFSVKLTLIVVIFLIVFVFAARFIGSQSGKYYRSRQIMTADLNGYVEEMMTAQQIVKVFNYEKRAIETFEEKAENLRKTTTKASTFGVMAMPVMGSLSQIMYAVVAIFGAFEVIAGSFTLGNITTFLQYTRTITRPITQLSQQLNSIFAAIAGAERIFSILDMPEEIVTGDVVLEGTSSDKKDLCWLLPKEDGQVEKVPVQGDVRFHNVDFGYEEGQTILKDISLFAKPGQKIAFVGSTGAGKTTITNLINRFYEIDGGTISLDGIDIQRINKFDLRSIMSMVLQDTHLFEGTIADNIRYGRLDATDEEVIEAAKLANAHHFITRLEDGYDTVIDSSGGMLSQGEQQLLSIARAAVADPVILILDEATSSVDTRTEKQISRGMTALMEGRTTFVIAHRLSTVRDADAIMVLEAGEIVERGNHDDLMAMQGRYYALNTGSLKLE